MANHIIEVRVDGKIASVVGDPLYVCGNSDYIVRFTFDAEWTAHETKTARFVKNNKEYFDVVFTGDQCAMPIIDNTNRVQIGVYAGNLCTTTAAIVNAQRSILCGTGVPAAPKPDVYMQIMAMLSSGQSIDPAAYGLPVLHFEGDDTGMSKDDAVTLRYVYGERSGTASVKWRGSSSLWYPKKNYAVTFDTSFEAKAGWGEQSKYAINAYWIDPSYLRNLFGAKLWGTLTRSREGVDEITKGLPNCGAIDGFPIWVTLNGKHMGIYMWTIPKGAWLFGMTGANSGEAVVCADAVTLYEPVLCDGTDFKIEYSASGDRAAVAASLNNMITALGNVQSAADLASLEQYVDVKSVVDYYVHMALTCNIDGINRNYQLFTRDGVKWHMSPYDMDAILGNSVLGNSLGWPNDWPMFTGTTGINKLIDTVKTYNVEAIKTRFTTARWWEFDEGNMMHELYAQAIAIPEILRLEDLRLWPERPGTATNNIEQILTWLRLRLLALDYNVTTV